MEWIAGAVSWVVIFLSVAPVVVVRMVALRTDWNPSPSSSLRLPSLLAFRYRMTEARVDDESAADRDSVEPVVAVAVEVGAVAVGAVGAVVAASSVSVMTRQRYVKVHCPSHLLHHRYHHAGDLVRRGPSKKVEAHS